MVLGNLGFYAKKKPSSDSGKSNKGNCAYKALVSLSAEGETSYVKLMQGLVYNFLLQKVNI